MRFRQIRSKEEFRELQLFAASFGHSIPDNSLLPIYSVTRGEKPIAYFICTNIPLVLPAFHTDPTICSPRDFKEIVEKATAAVAFGSIRDGYPSGQCWLGVDRDPVIPEGIIERVGYKDTGKRLFQFF